MEEVCFATNNEHKLHEVRFALQPDFSVLSLEAIGCKDELPETGFTLEHNAHQKAAYVFANYSVPCFADDTGLEVEALNNEPGVFSARYAGPQRNNEQNIDLLLANLTGSENRTAQFRTVICWINELSTHYFEGIVKGHITLARKGSMGFGYDAIFIPDGHTKTFAEMTMEEKNLLSHRAMAVKKLEAFFNDQESKS
jgi:XTP/dITP diphosphohydrolase